MQQAEMDKQKAVNQEVQHTASLMELCGVDMNSKSYKNFMQIDYSYDNNVISNAGGVVVGPGGSTTLNMQEQKTIHYLHRYALGFQLQIPSTVNPYQYPDYIIENALYLCQGQQARIGKKVLQTGDSRFFAAQQFGMSHKKDIQRFRKGLKLGLCGFSTNATVSDTSSQWIHYETGVIQQSEMSQIPITATTALASGNLCIWNCVVPLVLIFPEISEFEDCGAVYLDNGNTCQFNISFNQANQCLINKGGLSAPTYSLTNLHLIRCMSPALDDSIIGRIASNTIVYRGIRGYPFQVTPAGLNNNFTASVPGGCRLKRIQFSAFAGDSYVSTNEDSGVAFANTENIVTYRADGWSRLKYQMGYSPAIPIYEVILNVGSIPRVLNAYLVQDYENLDFVMDQDSPFDDELQRQLKQYYRYDCERFHDDLFGAVVDPAPVNVQLNLKAGVSTIAGQFSNGTGTTNIGWQQVNASTAGYASFADIVIRGYVVLEETFEMDRLTWKI